MICVVIVVMVVAVIYRGVIIVVAVVVVVVVVGGPFVLQQVYRQCCLCNLCTCCGLLMPLLCVVSCLVGQLVGCYWWVG